jgi:hypothetical protein
VSKDFQVVEPRKILNTAIATEREFNHFVSRRKMMCWVCQKDVPRNMGRESFMIKKTGDLLHSGNWPKKFICFSCKPEVQS